MRDEGGEMRDKGGGVRALNISDIYSPTEQMQNIRKSLEGKAGVCVWYTNKDMINI